VFLLGLFWVDDLGCDFFCMFVGGCFCCVFYFVGYLDFWVDCVVGVWVFDCVDWLSGCEVWLCYDGCC